MELESKKGFRWYELVYIAALLAILAWAVFFQNSHRVGVMDINAVAHGVGMDARMAEEARETQDDVLVKVRKIQDQGQQVLDALAKQMDAASATKKDDLRKVFSENQKRYQGEISKIRTEGQRHMLLVKATFRRRIQPVVDRVARKRGLDLVIDPSGTYVKAPKRVDITAAVVEGCRPLFRGELPMIDESLLGGAGAVPGAEGNGAPDVSVRE